MSRRFNLVTPEAKRFSIQEAIQKHENALADLLERVVELERAGEGAEAPSQVTGTVTKEKGTNQ